MLGASGEWRDTDSLWESPGLWQRLPPATSDQLARASFPVGRLVVIDGVALHGRLMLNARLSRVQVQTAHNNSKHTHTHPFNGPLSGTTQVSWYQKGKTNLDFTEARDSEWQWHQLAICKSAPRSRLITTPAPHHFVFYRSDALPVAQPTASKHCRHNDSKQVSAVDAQGSQSPGYKKFRYFSRTPEAFFGNLS